MMSITDQLKAMRAAMPARKDKAMRHGLLGHEIDALVLASVEAVAGRTADGIYDDFASTELTLIAIYESLRRLVKSGAVVSAQRKSIEKARYWPARLSDLATELGQDFAKRVMTFLDERGDASTKEVAEFIGYNESSARRALRRIHGVESYAVKAGRGRKLMWRTVK